MRVYMYRCVCARQEIGMKNQAEVLFSNKRRVSRAPTKMNGFTFLKFHRWLNALSEICANTHTHAMLIWGAIKNIYGRKISHNIINKRLYVVDSAIYTYYTHVHIRIWLCIESVVSALDTLETRSAFFTLHLYTAPLHRRTCNDIYRFR